MLDISFPNYYFCTISLINPKRSNIAESLCKQYPYYLNGWFISHRFTMADTDTVNIKRFHCIMGKFNSVNQIKVKGGTE